MNYPCNNCLQRRFCAFEFGFAKCNKWLAWVNEPLDGTAETEEPEITPEWAGLIMQRFEEVE